MLAYIGHADQLLTVQQSMLCYGKSQGTRMISVSNGSGLEVSILPDRCMDIYQVRFLGKNLSYIYPCGIVHPAYFARTDEGWLNTFYAGFLSTCGLTYTGPGEEDGGIQTSLHGVIGNMPATQFDVRRGSENGVPMVRIRGEIGEFLCGANLVLIREITIRYGVNRIEIQDRVENRGFSTTPHMMIYHCNFGYPLVSEEAEIVIDSRQVKGRDDHAEQHKDMWKTICPPQPVYQEMCFYHTVASDGDHLARAGIRNKREGIAAMIEYDPATLDHFVQWNMFQKGEYVVGLEPCNATIDGRIAARKDGSLKHLGAGESVTHRISFYFESISGAEDTETQALSAGAY